jgi:hypothetical protein
MERNQRSLLNFNRSNQWGHGSGSTEGRSNDLGDKQVTGQSRFRHPTRRSIRLLKTWSVDNKMNGDEGETKKSHNGTNNRDPRHRKTISKVLAGCSANLTEQAEKKGRAGGGIVTAPLKQAWSGGIAEK